MLHQPTDIAILFFSRTAQAEAKSKNLLGPTATEKANTVLHKQLHFKTKRLLESTNLVIFNWHEHLQTAKGFGPRLSQAVQHVFSQGFTKVIIIGNDSPQLNHSHFQQAVRHLQENNSVVGTTPQGGAYLIGFSQSQFKAPGFENLAWQTFGLAAELGQYFKNQNLVELGSLADVNNFTDVRLLAQLAKTDSLLRFLLGFVPSLVKPLQKVKQSISITLNTSFLRGPPAVEAYI